MSEVVPNVLVTGGARRIGRALAMDLAAHGWAVLVHYNTRQAEAEAVRQTIRASGGRAEIVQADLSDRSAARDLVSRASDLLGPLSVVVNNASVFDDDDLSDFDWATWDRHFALHVEAPVAITRAFARHMAPDTDGLVVNMIDQRVLKTAPKSFTYSLSKAGLWDATRMLAQALAPRVRVNAIGPGPTLPSPRQHPDDFRRQTESLLLARGPDLSEFGATVRYLWRARSVTGQMIALDGGQHLAWETPDVAGIPE
ncbi:MAG: SDR family oxidoreductase [Rhizobiaceae bacterium]|nr:SDR family oxidoreductase [Rhizobiaceae bacterium]